MKRTRQYLLTGGVIAVALAVGYLGFQASGGAVPWGKRFAAVVSGGASGGDGIFQFGRGGLGGFVLAGPLRDSVGSFVGIVALLVVGSVGLYWYSDHTGKSGGHN